MLTNINERTLSKKYNTKVRSFPGASVRGLFDYLKPLLKKKPGKIILIIGVNSVKRNSAQSMISVIKSLIQFIHESIPDCHVVVSEILKREKDLNGNINEYIRLLKAMNCYTLRKQNITFDILAKEVSI